MLHSLVDDVQKSIGDLENKDYDYFSYQKKAAQKGL